MELRISVKDEQALNELKLFIEKHGGKYEVEYFSSKTEQLLTEALKDVEEGNFVSEQEVKEMRKRVLGNV